MLRQDIEVFAVSTTIQRGISRGNHHNQHTQAYSSTIEVAADYYIQYFPKFPVTVTLFSLIIVLIPVIVAPTSTSGNDPKDFFSLFFFPLHSGVRIEGLFIFCDRLGITNNVRKAVMQTVMTLIQASISNHNESQTWSSDP